MDSNAKSFLKGKDWRNIQPCGGRYVVGTISASPLAVESFYIKPVAAFVPHILIPNHTPSCPHCECSKDVDTFGSNVKWIKQPKVLFGVSSHRYLDTKLYYCQGCNRRFSGYDKKSMQLDANQWAGYFPFNLSNKFAVDDELYSFIVNSSNLPTATIYRELKDMTMQKYFSDQQYYLYLVGANRIKMQSTGVSMDDNNVDEDATNITAKNQLQQESINQYMKTVPVPPPPGLGSTERELEYFLRDALSSCIIHERYPRCVIQVVIQIVQADGSVLGSAVNCALLALMDAGVAMWGLPVASTCVVIPKSCYDNTTTIDEDDAGVETTKEKHDDVIWLDPTAEEEAGAGHAIVVIVTDDTKQNQQTIEKGEEVGEGGIITSFTFGPLSLQGLLSSIKCMKETSSAAMVAFMRLAVEQKVQREVQTLWS